MDVERFWCHEANNIRCVRESDYDALAQQLAASEAEVVKLNEAAAFMDNVSQGIEDGLRAQLAARDKRLEEAVGLLRCAPWANWTWWARDTRAFLSRVEAKEND